MSPFVTDDEGIEHWVFSQPDDCDHLGRANHASHGCEYDDPPEDDPDGAEAQRIAEEYADAAAELARIEAEEAHDRAGEQWQEAAYQPAPPDPYSGGVS